MAFPSFFSEIQPLVVHDRLAEFLGAADGGVIEYRYADAVKLAGEIICQIFGHKDIAVWLYLIEHFIFVDPELSSISRLCRQEETSEHQQQ